MKELDFLPEWYKDRRKWHSQIRKQYVALAAVFLVMMTFNLMTMHRATRLAAEVTHFEDQRTQAEAIVHEFNRVTKGLNQLKTRAELIQQIDSGIDTAAILAELSHIVDESLVLSRVELVAEPFPQAESTGRTAGSGVRVAGRVADTQTQVSLGKSKLRIVLAGVAARTTDVPDLVYKLEQSPYFQQVRPLSYGGKAKIQTGSPAAVKPQTPATNGKALDGLEVTSFEVMCYLANYTEGGK